MQKFVNNLRKKPEHVRRNILYGVTFGVTGIILLFWFYTLSERLSTPETKEAFANDLKPLTILRDNLTNAYDDISTNVSNINQ